MATYDQNGSTVGDLPKYTDAQWRIARRFYPKTTDPAASIENVRRENPLALSEAASLYGAPGGPNPTPLQESSPLRFFDPTRVVTGLDLHRKPSTTPESVSAVAEKPRTTSGVGATALPTISEYNNQGLPGAKTDTRTAMGADSRAAPVLMRYGDEFGGQAIIEGTNTPRAMDPRRVNAPAAAPRTGPNVDGTYERFDPQTASQAAGYSKGGGVGGVRNAFSAEEMDNINAGIRTRVAAGGANTFSGYGMPKTPEQQQYEGERFAQGTELANQMFAQAAAIDAKKAAEDEAMFTYAPGGFAGSLVKYRAEKAQAADASRQRELATQEAVARMDFGKTKATETTALKKLEQEQQQKAADLLWEREQFAATPVAIGSDTQYDSGMPVSQQTRYALPTLGGVPRPVSLPGSEIKPVEGEEYTDSKTGKKYIYQNGAYAPVKG